MATEKRALMVTFEPDELKPTADMRDLFIGSYPRFAEMEAVEYKCWWVDQENRKWGAIYVFKSEEELQAYVASDIWLKVVPEKYGCVPSWVSVEIGSILSKTIIVNGEKSWLSN